MSRHPIWFIFIFVSASILVASGYNAYVLSDRSTFRDGSKEMKAHVRVIRSMWGGGACADQSARNIVYEEDLKTFAPIFRETRQRGSGEVNFACLAKSAGNYDAFLDPLETSCSRAQDFKPDRSCQGFEGLHVVYNVIMDISDCLEMSQREILPLFASESGFLPDLLSVRMKPTDSFFKTWRADREQYAQSGKASCRRLTQVFPESPDLAASSAQSVCPSLREGLFKYLDEAQKFKKASSEIAELWESSELDSYLAEMDTRLEDRLILRYWVHLLAHFTTSQNAMTLVQDFVISRKEQTAMISPGEISWQKFLKKDRSPASVGSTLSSTNIDSPEWSSYLRNKVDTATMTKIINVARWLSWVKDSKSSSDCATELWTIE